MITREQIRNLLDGVCDRPIAQADADPEALNIAHLRSLGEGAILLPGAEALCRRLAGNHRLYLLTNAVASVQRSRLQGSVFSRYITDAFISEDAGASKPSAAYYDYVRRCLPDLTAAGRAVAEERSLEAVGRQLREIYRRENILPLPAPAHAQA